MSESPSLVGRALIALALTIGFYLMAIGLSIALLLLPLGLYGSTGHVSAQLTIFCVVSAILVLYSIAPRIDRFVAPGPKLVEADHPKLFEVLRNVADATDQKMPADVYLVPDLNAWVANRGGVLGVGSRRVMGLGLPTFQALTVHQFSAVIAHEFGHYHHGDVALGPLLYRVRQGIARTLQALEERNNILQVLFDWYGHLFMRVTTAISRQQEYSADALAARVMGKQALSSGLEIIHASAHIFDGYWGTEVVPVLASGKRPRIADGFRRFSDSPQMREVSGEVLKAVMEAPEDPFDTHPSLPKRLAALTDMPEKGTLQLSDNQSAISLLGNTDGVEAALLAHLIRDEAHRPTQIVEWDDIGEAVWVPIWRTRVTEEKNRIKGIKCADAAALAVDPGALAVRMKLAATAAVATDQHRYDSMVLYGSALALILSARGGVLELAIGTDPVVRYRGIDVKPFLVCRDIAAGTLLPSEWLATCEQLDIANVDLADAESAVAATM